YYINSTDGGLSFNPPSVRLNTDATAAEQGAPAIAVAPDRSVNVVWRDPSNGAKGPDIYYVKSTNLGGTWGTVVIVNRDTGNAAQTEPTIAVNASGAIFVAWTDSSFTSTAPDIAATGTSWSVVTVFPVPIIQQAILASVRDVVAPTASAGSSATVDQGTAASFDGSGSADNLGIASASWDFGDGSTSMGLTASHS